MGGQGNEACFARARPDLRASAMMRADAMQNARFAPLPRVVGGFSCLVADVPLQFSSNSPSQAGPQRHAPLPVFVGRGLATLPVGTSPPPMHGCIFWATGPCLPQALGIIAAWGFDFGQRLRLGQVTSSV